MAYYYKINDSEETAPALKGFHHQKFDKVKDTGPKIHFDFSKHVLIELLDDSTPEAELWKELGLSKNKNVVHKRIMIDSHRVKCRRAVVMCIDSNAAKQLVEHLSEAKIMKWCICAVTIEDLMSDLCLFEKQIIQFGDRKPQHQLLYVSDLSRPREPAGLVRFLKEAFSPFGTILSVSVCAADNGYAYPEGIIKFAYLSEAFAAELALDQFVVDMERLSVTSHHNILLSQCDLRLRLRSAQWSNFAEYESVTETNLLHDYELNQLSIHDTDHINSAGKFSMKSGKENNAKNPSIKDQCNLKLHMQQNKGENSSDGLLKHSSCSNNGLFDKADYVIKSVTHDESSLFRKNEHGTKLSVLKDTAFKNNSNFSNYKRMTYFTENTSPSKKFARSIDDQIPFYFSSQCILKNKSSRIKKKVERELNKVKKDNISNSGDVFFSTDKAALSNIYSTLENENTPTTPFSIFSASEQSSSVSKNDRDESQNTLKLPTKLSKKNKRYTMGIAGCNQIGNPSYMDDGGDRKNKKRPRVEASVSIAHSSSTTPKKTSGTCNINNFSIFYAKKVLCAAEERVKRAEEYLKLAKDLKDSTSSSVRSRISRLQNSKNINVQGTFKRLIDYAKASDAYSDKILCVAEEEVKCAKDNLKNAKYLLESASQNTLKLSLKSQQTGRSQSEQQNSSMMKSEFRTCSSQQEPNLKNNLSVTENKNASVISAKSLSCLAFKSSGPSKVHTWLTRLPKSNNCKSAANTKETNLITSVVNQRSHPTSSQYKYKSQDKRRITISSTPVLRGHKTNILNDGMKSCSESSSVENEDPNDDTGILSNKNISFLSEDFKSPLQAWLKQELLSSVNNNVGTSDDASKSIIVLATKTKDVVIYVGCSHMTCDSCYPNSTNLLLRYS